jgi:hypothetical protein
MSIIKLAIGLPSYGSRIQAQAAEMWMTLGSCLADSRERFELVKFSIVDVCGVDVARNRLVEEAITAKADWLFMVDSDTWHHDGFDILSMISKADREGAAVVVAPVPKRDPNDPHLMIYRQLGTERDSVHRKILDNHPFELVPIDSAATAFMAMRVSFVEKLPKPWFRFQYIEGTNRFVSEDLGFCAAVKENGGKIFAYREFTCKHLHRPSF